MNWHLVFCVGSFLFTVFVVYHHHDFSKLQKWVNETEKRLTNLEHERSGV